MTTYTVYYFPNPANQPSNTDVKYGPGDFYVTNTSAQLIGTAGTGIVNAGKTVWGSYKPNGGSLPWLPGLNPGAAPTPPSLIASVLVANKTAAFGASTTYDAATVYGGSGVVGTSQANSIGIRYTVTSTAAIPSWISFTATRSLKTAPDPNNSGVLSYYNALTVSAVITSPPSGAIGTYTFTAAFTDGSTTPLTASATFSVQITSGAATLQAIVDYPTTTLTQYASITAFSPVRAVGGATPITYTLTSGTLPTGVSFNTANGQLSGTPTQIISSPRSYIVTVSDIYNSTATGSFTLQVNAPQPVLTPVTTSKTFTQGVADSFTPATASGGTGALTFSIKASTPLPSGLSINPTTGLISGTATGASNQATYTVVVTDSNSVPQTASLDITITVNALTQLKANQSVATTALSLNTPISTPIIPVTASPTGYGTLTYFIDKTLPTGLTFSTSTGAISGTPTAISGATTYNVTISDQASQSSTNSFSLSVVVTPVSLVVQNPTNSFINTIAITPFTPILGSGGYGSLTYAVSPALPSGLTLNTSTGQITGTPNVSGGALNYANTYRITISDSLTPTAQTKSDTFNLTIATPPAITTTQNVPTSALITNVAVSNLIPVKALGGYGSLSYAVSPSLPTGLTFSTSTGAINGTRTTPSSITTYTVTVTDSFTTPQTATNTFQLSVAYPTLTANLLIPSKTLTRTQAVASFIPVQGSGGVAPLTYSFNNASGSPISIPPGLNFDTTTGAISGTPSQILTATNYKIIVTDSVSQTASQTFSLTITDPYITPITTTVQYGATTLTRGLTATPFIPVIASGGSGTLTYTLKNAANTATATLPTGLTYLTTNGQILGTPSVTSSITTYTVFVTDTAGQSSSKTFTLTVNDPPALHLITTPPSNITKNATATFTPVTVDPAYPGVPPYVYTLKSGSTLPANLNINSSTGIISGIPTSTGTTTIIITVSDSDAQSTDSDPFNIVVVNPTALSTSLDAATTTVNQNTQISPFTPVSATGGYGTLSYAVSPGLPTGLTFSTTTGRITGTPSVYTVSSNYVVTVSDQAQQTSSKTFALRVAPPSLTVTVITAASTLKRTRPTSTINIVSVTGGYTPYDYALKYAGTTTTAVLPNGLSFSTSTGQITGTPQATQASTSYDLIVTDGFGTSITKQYSLTVLDLTALNTTLDYSSLTFYRGTAVTPVAPVSASGGEGSISFSIDTPLSAGLSFSPSNALISGTPTALHAVSSYTITATDSVGQTSSKTFTVTVLNPALVVTPTQPSWNFTKNLAITRFYTVNVVGGTGIYTYSINPSLVSGLTFFPTTGAISGTASANTNTTYTITVTDSDNTTASASFDIIVTDAPAVVATLSIATKTIAKDTAVIPFTPVTGSGGGGTLSYSISPTLPASLSFNTTNGSINGTPGAVAASTNYTVTVSDQTGQTDSKTFALIITPKPIVAVQNVPTTTLTRYSQVTTFQPVSYTGGEGSVTFSLPTSPPLPDGVEYNIYTGYILGTPTSIQGPTTYTVTVTDSYSTPQTSSATFSLSVITAAPPALYSTLQVSSVTTTAGVAVNTKPVVGSGGYGTLAYSVSPALPTGLTINSATGQITGSTAIVMSATTYTVTVTDSVPQSSSKDFTLTVLTNNPSPGMGYTGSQGYTGSEGLQGPIGGQGYTGSRGNIGYTGSLGYTGSRGDVGFTGSIGQTGLIGYDGSQGYTGSRGDTGFAGSQGNLGYTGSQGVGYTGSRGDTGYVGSASTVVGYTGSVGFTGSKGDTGYVGSASTVIGYTGSQGDIGFTGSQGPSGAAVDKGYTGSQGDLGYTGSQGVGYTGSKGDVGYVGSASTVIGFTGSKGDVGYTGSLGGVGYTGSASTVIGYTGSAGTDGYAGSVGFTGSAGLDGAYAALGYTGSQGPIGYTGSMGTEAIVYISTTVPSSPYNGKLWYKSDEGKLYVYYTDPDSSQWVGITATGRPGYTGSSATGSILLSDLKSVAALSTDFADFQIRIAAL